LRRQVADPLGGLWESDILPLLLTRPGVRPVTVLEKCNGAIPIAIGIGCGARWSVASAPGAPPMRPSAKRV
jgi:hypothetical protein